MLNSSDNQQKAGCDLTALIFIDTKIRIIVHAVVKIILGFASYDFDYC